MPNLTINGSCRKALLDHLGANPIRVTSHEGIMKQIKQDFPDLGEATIKHRISVAAAKFNRQGIVLRHGVSMYSLNSHHKSLHAADHPTIRNRVILTQEVDGVDLRVAAVFHTENRQQIDAMIAMLEGLSAKGYTIMGNLDKRVNTHIVRNKKVVAGK